MGGSILVVAGRVLRAALLVVFFVALPLAAAAQTLQWVVRDRDGGLVGPVLLQGAGGAGPDRLTDDSPLWVARRISGGMAPDPRDRERRLGDQPIPLPL